MDDADIVEARVFDIVKSALLRAGYRVQVEPIGGIAVRMYVREKRDDQVYQVQIEEVTL